MISDTLHDAGEEIRQYLADDFYSGQIRAEIEGVLALMDAVRRKLDTSPSIPVRADKIADEFERGALRVREQIADIQRRLAEHQD